MTDLPPELQQFATFLDAQPAHVRANFRYCLALLMVQAGKAEMIETIAGASDTVCIFKTVAKTVAGDVFTIPKPAISPKNEAILINRLRMMLDAEWLE